MATLSQIADVAVSAYPNAGPNEFGSTTKAPRLWPRWWRNSPKRPVNLLGGCCGTTPDHIRAIADAVRGLPRTIPQRPQALRLAGLEPFTVDGDRCSSMSGSAPMLPSPPPVRLIREERYATLAGLASR